MLKSINWSISLVKLSLLVNISIYVTCGPWWRWICSCCQGPLSRHTPGPGSRRPHLSRTRGENPAAFPPARPARGKDKRWLCTRIFRKEESLVPRINKTHRRQCKMSSSKILTLRQVFICLKSRTPYPPPPVTHCIIVYSILIHTGKRGRRWRVEPERRLEVQQFTKLGRKYQHDSLYLRSIDSDKHLPQSPIAGQLF